MGDKRVQRVVMVMTNCNDEEKDNDDADYGDDIGGDG